MPSLQCDAPPMTFACTSMAPVGSVGVAADVATMPPTPSDPTLSVVARTLSVLVRLYQAARAGRPSPCRYWPTCSTYALDALGTHGAARGVALTVRRLFRCHPWAQSSGFDPVPEAVR